MRSIASIEAEIRTTAGKLETLRQEYTTAIVAACPHKVGDVVKTKQWTHKTGNHVVEMVVRGLNTRYSSHKNVVLECSPRKKNGEWAKTVKSVWSDTVVKEPK